jgi:hypothetical protein
MYSWDGEPKLRALNPIIHQLYMNSTYRTIYVMCSSSDPQLQLFRERIPLIGNHCVMKLTRDFAPATRAPSQDGLLSQANPISWRLERAWFNPGMSCMVTVCRHRMEIIMPEPQYEATG